MRKIVALIAALPFALMFPGVAAAESAAPAPSLTVGVVIYAGQSALCASQLGPVCGDVAAPAGFGEGATGWVGHRSDWGGPFVLPASFGYVTPTGQQFNVYEPLSDTLVNSCKWLLPSGVDAQSFATGIAQYNPDWTVGRAIFVPNN